MSIFLFRKRRGATNGGHHVKVLCLERLEDRTLLAPLTIAQENQLPGTPESVWDNINGIGDPAIQGYATNMSVNAGLTQSFKINDTASGASAAYRIDIYRLGYYQGNGARLVATIPSSQTTVQAQPGPLYDSSTGMYDAGNWAVSASWTVPSDATSGVYLADVVRNNGGMSQIVFVVRNDALRPDGSRSDILFKTADATWEAYNDWGGTGPDSSGIWRGNSLYTGTGPGYAGSAYAVSYNRPLNNRGNTSITNVHDQFFYAEYPIVRWLEANGYDVSYFTDVDADRDGSLLRNHKIVLSVGHDEYWSAGEYNNFMAARDAGVNLAFFSGNEIFWNTRWANSLDPSHTAYRTLMDYKETHANAQIDPLDTSPTWTWTGTKEDPRFSPPADGGIDQNQLTGTFFTMNQGADPTGTSITVPGTYAQLRFWRNTAIAGLQPNQSMNIGGQVLGYEWDEDIGDGFRPAGQIDLSSTTHDVNGPGGQYVQRFADYGNTVLPRTATHNLTLYRASSGALVFGAGTVQWSWGLDSDHDGSDNLPDPDVNMKQATVNLFADMGNVQPATLQSGLVAATASTDTTPPTSAITSPTSGATLQCGTPVTIAGTATDAGGGRVAGVEVSVDNGQTWHPAQGQANWTYTWTTGAPGPVTIRSRAVDDSGNLETQTPSVGVTVSQPSGPLSIWSATTTPSVVDAPDSAAIELGMRFRSDISGFITGVRFYKGLTNTGTHVGNLWDNAGHLLATAIFTSETASGWQQVNFATPVAVTAGTTYIASYHTNVGNYAVDTGGFAAWSRNNANTDRGPLHALMDISDSRNGVFQYGPGGFPSNISPDSSNYWVDVVFATNANVPPTVTGETPVPSAEGVSTTSPDVTATFSEAMDPSSLSFVLKDSKNNIVPARAMFDSTLHTATLTPSAALNSATTYTATVSASNSLGTATATWSFSTTGLSSLWSQSVTPLVASANDPNAVELGVKFRSDVAGSISGIRFYKGPSNTGTHVGHLWTDSGTSMATATFTNETASGWQQVTFPQPVPIAANTTYVASYFAPAGGYAVDGNYFANAEFYNPPLHALKDGMDGGDGVYAYGSGNTFPTGSYQSDNYWVDVVFITGTSAPATHLNVSAPASATAGAPFNVTVTAQSASNTTDTGYTGTVHFTSSDTAAGLPANYQFTTADAGTHTFPVTLNTTGNQTITATDTVTASITGSATVMVTAPTTNHTIWSDTATPSTPDGGPDSPVEVGVKFRSDVAGSITGLRFYKSSGNTGTHVGNLWDNAGNLLATATFTSSETASGWQQVNFATPVAVTAGTIYIASYHTNVGHYADDTNYFVSGVDNAPLHALPDGMSGFDGVYAYGSTSIFPTNGWQASNYWVDVVFTPSGTASATTVAASAAPVAAPSPVNIPVNPQQQGEKQQKQSHTVKTDLVVSSSGSVAPRGTFISTVLDKGQAATWDRFFVPKADLPPGVRLVVEARTGNTPTPDPTWSAFSTVHHGGAVPNPNARYLQYRVSLDIPPGQSLRLPIPFHFDITSTANEKTHEPQRSDQAASHAPVPAPVLAGNPGVSPTEPFESPEVNDAGQAATWKAVSWTANLPSSATLVVEISTGNTPKPDRTWSAWSAVGNGGEVPTPARYLRLRVRVLTENSSLRTIPVNISLTKNASGVSPVQFPGSTIGNRINE